MRKPENAREASDLVRRCVQSENVARLTYERAGRTLTAAGAELVEARMLAEEFLSPANIRSIVLNTQEELK